MKPLFVVVSLVLTISASAQKNATSPYFPPPDSWEHRTPRQTLLADSSVRNAIAFAISHEIKAPRNGALSQFQSFGREPMSAPIGPLKDRGEPTGLILHHGYIVAEWGEPARVDMSHSITKSFLSTVVGLAVDRGMIKSTGDTVYKALPPIELYTPGITSAELISPFETPHNRRLTWK